MFEPLHDAPEPSPSDRFIPVMGGHVIVRGGSTNGKALLPDEADLVNAGRDAIVLGRVGDVTWWTFEVEADVALPDGFEAHHLRTLFAALDEDTWNIAGRATQIIDWRRDNQFCGRCAGPMDQAPGERAMRCPRDGFSAYPRLSPAVIVLVEHPDGRALLARNGLWEMPMYSTLAGFVEPGESLEDTIHREIREEVGIEVEDIRYFASQPWPFPNSLMLGFFATWAGGDITVDGEEIVDADWFSPTGLPETIPPQPSIARALIDHWLEDSGANIAPG